MSKWAINFVVRGESPYMGTQGHAAQGHGVPGRAPRGGPQHSVFQNLLFDSFGGNILGFYFHHLVKISSSARILKVGTLQTQVPVSLLVACAFIPLKFSFHSVLNLHIPFSNALGIFIT